MIDSSQWQSLVDNGAVRIIRLVPMGGAHDDYRMLFLAWCLIVVCLLLAVAIDRSKVRHSSLTHVSEEEQMMMVRDCMRTRHAAEMRSWESAWRDIENSKGEHNS